MSETQETERELLGRMGLGLWLWQEFLPGQSLLYIGAEGDPLPLHLSGKLDVACASLEESVREEWREAHEGRFRWIVSLADLERERHPEDALLAWGKLLSPEGRLLLAMHNRLGLRYFCGDRDPYTGRNFDGIENYQRAYGKPEDAFRGRAFSKAEIAGMLERTGWKSRKFYAVLPGLEHPDLLYAEGYLPQEDIVTRLFPTYHTPGTVFLEEERLYRALAENGAFHPLANAYVVECARDEGARLSDVLHVTNSLGRGREHAMVTTIHGSGIVTKRAACPEGAAQLQQLTQNMERLETRGIPVVKGRMEGGAYVMPYVRAESGQKFLKELLMQGDKQGFLEGMDRFRDMVLSSSETWEGMHTFPTEDGKEEERKALLFRHGYPDMVPLNSFWMDGQFVLYDQEFCMEDYPVHAVLARMAGTFYCGEPAAGRLLPLEELFARYGLLEERQLWQRMDWDFVSRLRKEKELSKYHARTRRDPETVNSNRQRMNWPAEDYRRLFEDIFAGADTRKLVLFGSGRFAERFLALYGPFCPVHAIVDNNEKRWGEEMHGTAVQSPEILLEMRHGEYKVIVCIKDYLSVMRQLDGMGIHEYSIFDPGKAYPVRHRPTEGRNPVAGEGKKKYHVGYVAGVFDLFHVGHLRLLKRAKEQCDYLIVGVVTDEGVHDYKKTETFVPFAERLEIVRACRYVDEAVEIPLRCGGTGHAWKLHHFDVQFSGSDYIDDPEWLRQKEFLEAHGATMEFFPYTESTSSTKLKELIERKLV